MTDQEIDEIAAFTKTIPHDHRAAFLETLGRVLSTSGDWGAGIVSRALLAAQRDTIGPRLQTTFLIR